jgi:polyhydroxybutyrate depolymerase
MLRGMLSALVACCAVGLTTVSPVAAERLPGCGAPPERPPQAFFVADRERHALVVLPDGYQTDLPHALVFGFHGRTNDNVQVRGYFGLEEAADRPTIYVYPAALTDRSGRFTWSDPGDPPDALRDFVLFDAILERLASAYCIDLDAVYVVGHSLGASFANSLACARADRIRGVAAVAGGITSAGCSGTVAGLLLHNPRDRAVPFSEGKRARDILLKDQDDRNGPGRRRFGDFECNQYGVREHPLLWCVHGQDVTPRGRFYPHQWPEGAAQAIFMFFNSLRS